MAPRNQTGRKSGGRCSPYHLGLRAQAQARMVSIRALRAAGLTYTEIGKRLDISQARVSKLFKIYGGE